MREREKICSRSSSFPTTQLLELSSSSSFVCFPLNLPLSPNFLFRSQASTQPFHCSHPSSPNGRLSDLSHYYSFSYSSCLSYTSSMFSVIISLLYSHTNCGQMVKLSKWYVELALLRLYDKFHLDHPDTPSTVILKEHASHGAGSS